VRAKAGPRSIGMRSVRIRTELAFSTAQFSSGIGFPSKSSMHKTNCSHAGESCVCPSRPPDEGYLSKVLSLGVCAPRALTVQLTGRRVPPLRSFLAWREQPAPGSPVVGDVNLFSLAR
jgi:hypothetical protein